METQLTTLQIMTRMSLRMQRERGACAQTTGFLSIWRIHTSVLLKYSQVDPLQIQDNLEEGSQVCSIEKLSSRVF